MIKQNEISVCCVYSVPVSSYIWLAGAEHFLAFVGLLGFHAVQTDSKCQQQKTRGLLSQVAQSDNLRFHTYKYYKVLEVVFVVVDKTTYHRQRLIY